MIQAAAAFPFSLDDIESWTMKRIDGTSVRFVFGVPSAPTAGSTAAARPVQHGSYYSMGQHCKHAPTPTGIPIFTGVNKAGRTINLFIADAAGTRAAWRDFDFVIDAGGVLGAYEITAQPPPPPVRLAGDQALTTALKEHVSQVPRSCPQPKARVLQIDWADRAAPELNFSFWPDLLEHLHGNVLVNCVGGHGRSGTMLTILMLLMTDYNAMEALMHLRAMHCPRAIESKVQHGYIGAFAAWLGRVDNLAEASQIKSWRQAFLALTNPTATPYQARLLGAAGKLPVEVVREEK